MTTGKFTSRTLVLFAIYGLIAVAYMGWCWHDSNQRIAQIERDFAPVEVHAMAPVPGARLSPVRTSPYPPARRP